MSEDTSAEIGGEGDYIIQLDLPETVNEVLAKLQQQDSSLPCDMVLQSEHEEVHAHSAILGAISPTLKDLCETTKHLYLVTPPNVLQDFVTFFYTGEVRVNAANAKILHDLAQNLNLSSLAIAILNIFPDVLQQTDEGEKTLIYSMKANELEAHPIERELHSSSASGVQESAGQAASSAAGAGDDDQSNDSDQMEVNEKGVKVRKSKVMLDESTGEFIEVAVQEQTQVRVRLDEFTGDLLAVSDSEDDHDPHETAVFNEDRTYFGNDAEFDLSRPVKKKRGRKPGQKVNRVPKPQPQTQQLPTAPPLPRPPTPTPFFEDDFIYDDELKMRALNAHPIVLVKRLPYMNLVALGGMRDYITAEDDPDDSDWMPEEEDYSPPRKRGRGRPKGSLNRPREAESEEPEEADPEFIPRGRGRGRKKDDLTCSKCGYVPRNKHDMKRHHRIDHYDPRDYTCHICGKVFCRIRVVEEHVRYVHKNEREFKCDICNAGFRSRFHLKRHVRAHNNERLHLCDICGYAAVQSGDLRRHIERHFKTTDSSRLGVRVGNRLEAGPKRFQNELNKGFIYTSDQPVHILQEGYVLTEDGTLIDGGTQIHFVDDTDGTTFEGRAVVTADGTQIHIVGGDISRLAGKTMVTEDGTQIQFVESLEESGVDGEQQHVIMAVQDGAEEGDEQQAMEEEEEEGDDTAQEQIYQNTEAVGSQP